MGVRVMALPLCGGMDGGLSEVVFGPSRDCPHQAGIASSWKITQSNCKFALEPPAPAGRVTALVAWVGKC